MPRANRHFLPNHVWHLTHRCHEKASLLKFARDRRRYETFGKIKNVLKPVQKLPATPRI